MRTYLAQIDRVLRGEATSPSALRFGTMLISVDKLAVAGLGLAALYGLCMSTYVVAGGADHAVERVLSSVLKLPLLFILTLLVTLPSLYVFNAIVGSRLKMESVIKLLIASLGVTTAVLASLGPIVAFFSLSTTSYSFMLLLNVFIFAVAGFLGLRFLARTLERITTARNDAAERNEIALASEEAAVREQLVVEELEAALRPDPKAEGAIEGEEKRADPGVKRVFRIWMVVFGLVGAQMGWVLRPFLGRPEAPFTWFSPREGSFFRGVLDALIEFLMG